MEVPYNDDQELVMDILRHGAAAEVIEPEPLRERVRLEFQNALARY